ncbi:hypothetical protein LWC35_17910 [Pseudonocardia kujensis]|uniref:hypothetical protein n=1 Tax=Pseudonocardia kujensis TaxID=1128675 RepID=UPI001E61E1C8|nr:hypothetical protein [Pseudonocardia kujensis]MCE0764769.1 hypothetical protein [Pseudonocardia kujensis]
MEADASAGEVDPGGGFRFAIGSASGPHSTVYRIWSSKNSSDFYLTAVPLGRTQKISLHESGQWSHSFLSEVAMQYVQRNADRHLERWERPNPAIPGFTRVYSITVPRTELRLTTQDLSDVRWSPDPGHGYWVRVEVILMDSAGAGTEAAWDDAYILGKLRLHNGERVVVVSQRFKPAPEMAQRLGAYRDMFLANESVNDMASAEFPVVGLHGHQDDGARTLIELAMSELPSAIRIICTGRPQASPAQMDVRFRNPAIYASGPISESPHETPDDAPAG